MAICCIVIPGNLFADDEQPVSPRSYYSLKGSIYSKQFGDFEADGYTSRFKFYLTTTILRFETLDELFDSYELELGHVGIKPQINFDIKTSIKNVYFVPSADFSLQRNFDIEKNVFAGSVTAAFRYDNHDEASQVISSISLTYGTRYDYESLNQSDYLRVSLGGHLRQSLEWKIKEHVTTIQPFVNLSYYLDELEIERQGRYTYEIDREFEIGLIFSTLPRIRIWRVKVPKIKISFVYNKDLQGVKITL